MDADNSSIGQEGKPAIFAAGEDWDSEQKLVTALSMLQQMEAKVRDVKTISKTPRCPHQHPSFGAK